MPRAVVIGGGIGGLTTAIALCRKNWDVSVHEATSELRPVGKGILVPNNAMQVVRRLGLAGRASEIGWPIRCFELGTASGTILSTTKLNELSARYGHSIIAIHRAELVEALAQLAHQQFALLVAIGTEGRTHGRWGNSPPLPPLPPARRSGLAATR